MEYGGWESRNVAFRGQDKEEGVDQSGDKSWCRNKDDGEDEDEDKDKGVSYLSTGLRAPVLNRFLIERDAGSLASLEQNTMQKSLVMTVGWVQFSI